MATSRDFGRFLWGSFFGSLYIPKDADLAGKTMIITGANTGLGFECAKHLARLNVSKLILGCRSIEKGNAAKEAITSQEYCKNTSIEVWQLDLTNYQSVLSFGERVRTTLPRLDAHISNAGVELTQFSMSEGVETTLTVNVLSTMLLNIAVLPKLQQTSSEFGVDTTLTTVGTVVHIFAPLEMVMASPLDSKTTDTFDLLSDPATADMGPPDQNMNPRYILSKAILHAVLSELASRAPRPEQKAQVTVNWVNPGWCASEIGRHKRTPPVPVRVAFMVMGRSAEQGARTLVHAALAGKQTHGCYLSESRVKPESDYLCSEKGIKARERLWRELMARIERISPEVASFIE